MDFRFRGFSLIELMVVLVIAAILMGIAVPAYRQYVIRADRADATSALLRMASNQERFYIQNNTYASAGQMATAPPAGLGISGTERGWYTLTIAARNGGLQAGYTATATVDSAQNQKTDTQCWTFTVDDRGTRTAQTNGGADNTTTCWR